MPGIKIKVPCSLRLKSDSPHFVSGANFSTADSDGMGALLALYATVLKFSSSAPYGTIPVYRVPFLLAEPAKSVNSYGDNNSFDIVPFDDGSGEEESYKAPVVIELEPREPLPGLVDVFIEANTDDSGAAPWYHNRNRRYVPQPIVPVNVSADAISRYYLFEPV